MQAVPVDPHVVLTVKGAAAAGCLMFCHKKISPHKKKHAFGDSA
jgi:hypothetical protein